MMKMIKTTKKMEKTKACPIFLVKIALQFWRMPQLSRIEAGAVDCVRGAELITMTFAECHLGRDNY
jgi:hypothetical protein